MNRFVHVTLRHFMQAPITDFGDGGQGGIQTSAEEQEQEEQEEQPEPEEEQEEPEEIDEEEVSLFIEGEKREEDTEAEDDGRPAPGWVKELRKTNREDKKRIRELEDQLRKQEPPKQKAPVLGPKPTMEDAEIDWDSERFEEALTAWHDRKRQIEQHEADQQKTEQQQKEAWQGKQTAYATGKTALRFKNVAEAEETACAVLDVTQQGIILQGSVNSALLIYAIGSNPKKAAELAAIKDPIAFAWAAAQLETKLKTESKKPNKPPAPEKEIRGQGRVSANTDKMLDSLREEAQRTGNTDKLMAYKRAQKTKQKS